MAKYFVVYRLPVETMNEWRKTPPEKMQEDMKKMGADMVAWTAKNKQSLVGEGYPLGKTKRLSAQGAQDVQNDLNYCQVVEAENVDAVVAMFKDNPHLTIPTSYLDIMEIPHMGM